MKKGIYILALLIALATPAAAEEPPAVEADEAGEADEVIQAPPAPPRDLNLGLILVGTGATLTAGAATWALLWDWTLPDHHRAVAECAEFSHPRIRENCLATETYDEHRGTRAAITAVTVVGLTTAAAGAGLLLWSHFVDSEADEAPPVVLTASPDGAGLTWELRW